MGNYGCSNSVLKWMNIFTMVLAIPILAMGIWLYTETGSECYTFLQKPIIVIGVAIFVISFIGCCGAANSWSFVLWIYLFFMAILIFILAAFTLFAFIVTADGGGSTIAGYNFKEYNLGDYSGWLQSQINSTSSWSALRSCMVQDDYCSHLYDDYPILAMYANATLSPLESGCCKPPVSCGFHQSNITVFDKTESSFNTEDCLRWSNDPTKMCYDCDSCKGGVAQYIRQEWRTSSVVLLVVVLLLSLLYCIGCCARHNSKKQPQFEQLEKERFVPEPPPGYQAGAQPGYQAGAQAGYQGGAQPGYQAGAQAGYQAGTQPGYQPRGWR